jgi:hypothetical protein
MRMAAQTPMIEAGRVFIPREASWLGDFLHEIAMFPRGRNDDQVDSVAQALESIAKPGSAETWIAILRQDVLHQYGLKPADLVVTFDHCDRSAEFLSAANRNIWREADDFYHCTLNEWEHIRSAFGVILIDGAER